MRRFQERQKKRQSSQQCHFALLGPKSAKAVHRTLMKSTPGLIIGTVKIGYSDKEFMAIT